MWKFIVAMVALGIALSLAGGPVLAAGDTTTATYYVPATSGGGVDYLGGTPWFDTGIILQPGTVFTITANGTWLACNGHACPTSPNGIGVRHVSDCAYIAPDLSAFSLIATMGKSVPFFVGVGPTAIQGGGTLRFAINDCYFGDNIGGFNVTVTYPTAAVIAADDQE